jgi:outer membrane receptor protein involved in Fe transport
MIFASGFTRDGLHEPAGTDTHGHRVLDIRNAAAATIRGVEVENTTRLGRGVQAGGHVSWLDATYEQYIAVVTFGTPPNAYAGRPGPSRQFALEFTVRR